MIQMLIDPWSINAMFSNRRSQVRMKWSQSYCEIISLQVFQHPIFCCQQLLTWEFIFGLYKTTNELFSIYRPGTVKV